MIAATDTSKRTAVVVADNTNNDAVKQGVSYAVVTGRALVLSSGADDKTRIAAIVNDAATEEVTVVGDGSSGDETSMDWVTEVPEEMSTKLAMISPGLSIAPDVDLMYSMVAAGSNAREVIVSKGSDLRSVATAALYAKRRKAVVGETYTATEYVKKLRSTLTSVTVVGVGATDSDAASLKANYSAGPSTPSFRVADIVLNPTQSTTALTYTSKSGATRYVAYDASGVQLGTSTGTTLTYSGTPQEVLLVAEGAQGSEIARLQIKVNNYESAADRQTAIAASSDGTGNHLRFLGAKNRPKLVTRTKVDPDGPPPTPSDTAAVALTCGTNFTDTPQDTQYQYDYRVATLSNNSVTCAGLATPGNDALDLGGISFPADQPVAATSSSRTVVKPRAASVSMLGKVTLAMGKRQSSRNVGTSAAGDDWPPIKFRYQTFIREKLVPGFMVEDPLRPFTAFHGDNRGVHPNGDSDDGLTTNHFRTRQDVIMHFGSSHRIELDNEEMGLSIRYACRKWLRDCVQTNTARASLNELSILDQVSENTSGSFRFKVEATLPLQFLAPAIDASVRVKGRPGRTTITGTHDRMPVHEIWWTVPGWTGEWYGAYASGWSYLPCLFGKWYPGKVNCVAVVNVTL